MRKKPKINHVVAILLPILFILGIVYSISSMDLLRADDSSTHLTVQKDDEDITGKDTSILENSVNLKLTAKENQLFRLVENEHVSLSSPSPDSRELPVREVLSSQFDLENELAVLKGESEETDTSEKNDEADKRALSSELIRVSDTETGKVTTYLKLLKDKTETVTFSREQDSQESTVELENVEQARKHKLFNFISIKVEETSEEINNPEEPAEPEEKKNEPEPLSGSETIEELEKRAYVEEESFKPIEIPAEEAKAKRGAKAASAISVTNAKVTVRTGTSKFDTSDGPGYDSGETNDLVRSFDSNLYLLSFSLEASDPEIKYSEIQYRVDMELPKAYGLDSAGKKRFNWEVVAHENTSMHPETDGTQTAKGYLSSTINSNGQILVPMFVNVYGAEHGTVIKPKLKITIISAKNESTGFVETINKEYDEANLSPLEVKDTKVSAKANIKPELFKGKQADFSNTVSGGTWSATTRKNWQVVGVGVNISLKELSGRDKYDFRGSTFPTGEIKFTLGTKSNTYQVTNTSAKTPVPTGSATSTSHAYPVQIVAGTYGTLSDNSADWFWRLHKATGRTLKLDKTILANGIPYGKYQDIHLSEPTAVDKSNIGVFDTGDVKLTGDTQVSIENYEPMWNPYTYNMSGSAVSKNNHVFATVSLLTEWNNLYIVNKGTGVFNSEIEISNISYEGNSHSGDTSVEYSRTKAGTGFSQHTIWAYNPPADLKENGVSLSGTGSVWNSTGSSRVNKGYEFTAVGRLSVSTDSHLVKKGVSYVRWNGNSAKFDSSRPVYTQAKKISYGVKASKVPNNTYRTQAQLNAEYTWFPTVEAAEMVGEITACKLEDEVVTPTYTPYFYSVIMPVVAVGPIGSYKDTSGNPNILLMNSFVTNIDGSVKQRPDPGTSYAPSTFSSTGTKTGGHHAKSDSTGLLYPGVAAEMASYGDTFFTNGVSITTTTAPEKPIYPTDETIKWKVNGNINGGNTAHTVRLTTTLSKGINYDAGSAVDGLGNKIAASNVSVTKKPDGTTVLVFTLDDLNPAKGDIAEVNFTTSAEVKDLSFDDKSVAKAKAHTVGEIWVKGSPSQKDPSAQRVRESEAEIDLYQVQQILLTKTVDKELLEVGAKDAANPSASSDITYTVGLENNSSDKLVDVNLLDVLPFDGDTVRGSDFNGSYKVKNIKMTKGTGSFFYTNSSVPPNQNPNATIPGLVAFPSGGDPALYENAKAIMAKVASIEVDEKVSFEVTLSPTGHMAGDLFRNQAAFNSKLELPVYSNIVQTRVFSRDLKGYVWYDDDYDGLIGTKEDGSAEDPVANIPVKLYRTSKTNTGYKKQLVKESLRGKSFIDGSGDSLVKTNASGEYMFEDLPEGEYLAEFIVGDLVVSKVVIVTKQLIGSDVTKNSKANPSDYKTPEYPHPELKDLPIALGSGKYIHHVTDVNAGLTRLSTIRLFKYIEGSAVDDGDGHLSDEEIEKTATPLQYAEFDLFEGNSTKPADKIGSATTDEYGWLEYTGLPPGDYTLVETKAPSGYELIKEPIKVNVPKYNYIVKVYVSDSGATLLPFTGGNKAMQIVLVVAGSLMLVGMLGIVHQFHPIKRRKRRVR
ncbi:SpaA isopeptide-forming pilin-related protein [Candidatus Enterococcus ferrettii]|uniref:SpaA-like prealbumin fold domain-containing protein n=1 Tax=Candidatus Enterococcus ferrettii TaxID=2815324 RepID=A0ABV0EN14_9ENTE